MKSNKPSHIGNSYERVLCADGSVGTAARNQLWAGQIDSWVVAKISEGMRSVRVHSVFSQSFNLVDTEGDLYTVISPHWGHVPSGILLERGCDVGLDGLSIRRGEPARVDMEGILLPVSGVRIGLERVTVFSTECSVIGAPSLVESIGPQSELCWRVLRAADRHGGFSPLVDYVHSLVEAKEPELEISCPVLKHAAAGLKYVADAFVNEDTEQLRNGFEQLLGLGPGLTPSGDDALLGAIGVVMTTVGVFGTQQWAKAVARTGSEIVRGRTTKISESYLLHALAGRLSGRQRSLAEALVCGSAQETQRATERVIEIGSSSGADMVLGMLVGIGALVRRHVGSRHNELKSKDMPKTYGLVG